MCVRAGPVPGPVPDRYRSRSGTGGGVVAPLSVVMSVVWASTQTRDPVHSVARPCQHQFEAVPTMSSAD